MTEPMPEALISTMIINDESYISAADMNKYLVILWDDIERVVKETGEDEVSEDWLNGAAFITHQIVNVTNTAKESVTNPNTPHVTVIPDDISELDNDERS